MDRTAFAISFISLLSLVLSGCSAKNSDSPKLDQEEILAIVERRMHDMDTEEIEIMNPNWHHEENAWSVVVWKLPLPERLHDAIVLYVNDDGEIIRKIPGR